MPTQSSIRAAPRSLGFNRLSSGLKGLHQVPRRNPHRASRTARRDDSVERIGEQAKRHCLKRLKTLIAFMEKGKFYDGDETREVVLNSLRTEFDRWASCHGIELLQDVGGEAGES